VSLEGPLVFVEPLERALLEGVHEFPGEPDRVRVDVGLVPVFSDERPLLGLAGLIDWRESGRLSALIHRRFCTADSGEQLLLPGDRRLPVDRLVLVGLGPRGDFDDARARAIAARLVEISVGLAAQSVLIALPSHGIDRTLSEATFEALLAAIEAHEQAAELGPGEPSEEKAQDDDSGPPAEPAEAPTEAPTEVSTEAPDEQGELPAEAPEDDSSPPEDEQGAALPSQGPRPVPPSRWWVAADEGVVPRLRRVLSGPPRAARGGASLHT
jgi:hypothetical protein